MRGRGRAGRWAVGAACVASLALAAAPAGGRTVRVPAPATAPDLPRLLAAGAGLHPDHFVERIAVFRLFQGRRVRVMSEVLAGHVTPGAQTLRVVYAADRHLVHSLYVGAYAYATAPGLASVDGGYAWVRERVPQLRYAELATLALIREPASEIAAASAVRELGRTVVRGRPVTEFAVSAAGSQSLMFFAPDGLLVRQVVTAGGEVTTYDTSRRVPAVLPVPPAGETIDLSRLSAAGRNRLGYLFAPPFA